MNLRNQAALLLLLASAACQPSAPPSTADHALSPEQDTATLHPHSAPATPSTTGHDFTYTPTEPAREALRFASMKSFYKEYRPSAQTFAIDVSRDTVLHGKEGTAIRIPAGCFQTTDGQTVNGPVTLSLREYYTFADMYFGQLTTTTDKQVLETGGMLQLHAFAADERLALRPGWELEIWFDGDAGDKPMELYYGQRQQDRTIDWQVDSLSGSPVPMVLVTEARHRYSLVDFFATRYRFSKANMVRLLDSTWSTSVSFDEHGEVIGYTHCDQVDPDRPKTEACATFFSLLDDMPRDPMRHHTPDWQSRFTFRVVTPETFRQERMEVEVEHALASRWAQESREEPLGPAPRNRGVQTPPGRSFFARVMGDINLDWLPFSLPANRTPPRQHLIVYLDDPEADVRLTLGGYRSLIPGTFEDGHWVFSNLPVGQPVTVVSTRLEDGALHMATERTTIERGENSIDQLTYTPCARIDELTTTLAALEPGNQQP